MRLRARQLPSGQEQWANTQYIDLKRGNDYYEKHEDLSSAARSSISNNVLYRLRKKEEEQYASLRRVTFKHRADRI